MMYTQNLYLLSVYHYLYFNKIMILGASSGSGDKLKAVLLFGPYNFRANIQALIFHYLS